MLTEKVKISGMCSPGEQTFQRPNTKRNMGAVKIPFQLKSQLSGPKSIGFLVRKAELQLKMHLFSMQPQESSFLAFLKN
jgi:hypothetical protein